MRAVRSLLAAAASLAGAGCAFAPSAPGVVVPEALRAPADESLVRTLDANGVQVYECRAQADGAGWVLVGPEATLQDAQGAPAGRHFAGPTWESRDGSRIVGRVKAQVDAPVAGALPWLLLETRGVGRKGEFSRITSVQSVATVGGVAPSDGCTAATIGHQARVPYSAQYVQYAKIL